MRIHPHVQRPFRLKTKAARGIGKLQAADAQVGQQSIMLTYGSRSVAEFREGAVDSIRSLANPPLRCVRDATATLTRQFQRLRILIEANQMTRCAEAFCDF